MTPNQIPGRSAVPAVQFHVTTQRLIAQVAHLTKNNVQAISLIQSSLPVLDRVQADFPGWLLTVAKAIQGPSRMITQLQQIVKSKPANKRGQIQVDILSLQSIDTGLRSFGVQLLDIALP